MRCDGEPFVRPYFITRLSGLSASISKKLTPGFAPKAVDRLFTVETRLERVRQQLSEKLGRLVVAINDRSIRGALVEVRRDLFSGRRARPRALARASESLPDDARSLITVEHELELERQSALAFVRQSYAEDVRVARGHLRDVVADADFQKGLVLSSPTLFGNLDRFRGTDPSGSLTSRDAQIERGMLRYVTRAAMKSTPFSRFCTVIPGTLSISASGESHTRLTINGNPRSKQSHVRLNKALYAVLWSHLKKRPAVRRRLVVEVNPTLTIDDGRLRFLAQFGREEIFQRLTRTDAVDAVLDVAIRAEGAIYDDLVETVVSAPPVDASHAEAREFVDTLIAIGLLRLRSIVAEQVADWDGPLAVFLEQIEDDDARLIATMLGELRCLVSDYAFESAANRMLLGTKIRDCITSCLSSIGAAIDVLRRPSIYEDATACAELQICVDRQLETAFVHLKEFLAIIRAAGYFRQEQATMTHFFEQQYGATSRVPLLQFYEDYSRAHFKELLLQWGRRHSGLAKDIGNPFALAFIDAVRKAQRELAAAVAKRWADSPTSAEICLTREELQRAVGELPRGDYDRHSAAVFVQILPHTNRSASLLLNGAQCVTGYGKMYSRFLYMLPEELYQALFRDNCALAGAELIAEIAGDANFNANLHPPLFPFEIAYPTCEGGNAGAVRCTDLDVVKSKFDEHALWLIYRTTGQRVIPVDTGFLNSIARPPLYQLLLRFTPLSMTGLVLPDHPTPGNETKAATRSIMCRPRITYQGSIVLARRRWVVPNEFFPFQNDAHEVDYFVSVNRWRRDNGIPEEVYARVAGAGPEAAVPLPIDARPPNEDESTNKVRHMRPGPEYRGGDWQKPQYINFSSPLLVNLFARLPGPLRSFRVVMEERYPRDEDLVVSEGAQFTAEVVLQVDTTRPLLDKLGTSSWSDNTPSAEEALPVC
jgi:hypothetical protein